MRGVGHAQHHGRIVLTARLQLPIAGRRKHLELDAIESEALTLMTFHPPHAIAVGTGQQRQKFMRGKIHGIPHFRRAEVAQDGAHSADVVAMAVAEGHSIQML